MKYILTLISLIWLMNAPCLSQDTVRIYLNEKYEVIENKDKAVFIREAYVSQRKRYHITDKYLNGQLIVEGEYSSLDPWTEDGSFKYYDETGGLYSEGRYVQGSLIGKWVYFNYKSRDTVDYTAASKMLNNSFLKGMTLPKSIPASKKVVDYIQDNVQFPARARDVKDKANVELNIVLTRNKHIIPDIVTSSHKDLSFEICRVLMTVPDTILWRGLDTSVINNLHMTVNFKMRLTTDTVNSYVFVSEQALFQGGDINTFREYVQNNLKIPPDAKMDPINARATIQFRVRYDGVIDSIELLRTCGNPFLDELAVKSIKNTPRWKPAMNGNVMVSQLFVIPIILVFPSPEKQEIVPMKSIEIR
jgi:TonB family protein